jgi:Zn-dependent alcohol dehydrogenase
VVDGEILPRTRIRMMNTGKVHEVDEVGWFSPRPRPAEKLTAGEVGYVTAAIKNVVDARVGDTAAAVQEIIPGGPDYGFEAVGREESIRQAWDTTRAGGTVVVVGMMPRGSTLTIDPWWFVYEKTLKGCFLGSARLPVDIPRIVDLYREGRLELDELVGRRIPLEELPDAFGRLRAGEGLRQLVVFD